MAGLTAGLIIIVMSTTGVLLTYERQVISWADRRALTTPVVAGGDRQSLARLVETAEAQTPGKVAASIVVSNDPTAAVQVSFGRDGTAGALGANPVCAGPVVQARTPAKGPRFQLASRIRRSRRRRAATA